MNDSTETTLPAPRAPLFSDVQSPTFGWRNFLAAVFVLLAAFSLPLRDLAKFSFESELYSHLLLVPMVSVYLVWLRRSLLPAQSAPDYRLALLPFILGGALLVLRFSTAPVPENALAFSTLALVLFFWGLCALFLGKELLRAIIFPLGFLVFMAPFPTAVVAWIETALQHASADAAYGFFTVAGTTMFRQDTFFQLPGMKLLVAPECSGIHSTLALFITSLVAGYLFLRSPVKRVVLALVVIPLAIVRNGLRIFVIGELCVRVGPEMIDSYLHRHGGPIFFALSLIPFSAILWLLFKSERRPSPVRS
jgi:exosortase C (VPDSG-CTERM-specific)